jgi:ribose transport system ATP-binding protein
MSSDTMKTSPDGALPDAEPEQTPLLALSRISKRFGGVLALDNVDFAASTHSIHAILGENGAGKSTLIKVIGGAIRPDTGNVALAGAEIQLQTPRDSIRHGIACVFQELSLIPDLSVADNICITDAPRRFGLVDVKSQLRRTEALLASIGCEDINPRLRVKDLPLSRRQLIEIAKALGRRPRILILDEATSALTAADAERVYRIVRDLRQRGLAILYISHRMHEIEDLADTCTVFRSGSHIASFRRGAHDAHEIVQMMIGREITQVYPAKPAAPAGDRETVLSVDRLSWSNRLSDITLSVGRGEIVGLGGLDGQGQRELLLGLFGVLRETSGTVALDGRPIHVNGPAAACAAGLRLALVPEDRKTEGLVMNMSIRENMTLAALDRISRRFLIDRGTESKLVSDAAQALQIKAATLDAPVGSLSGGNQQKVVLAKWLMTEPRVILLLDPTRGIDVGSKEELYRIMRRLADAGAAILFYSTDYEELIGMSDRIVILYQGRIVRELSGEAITEANIVAASLSLPAGTVH